MFIDTHAHLYVDQFNEDLDDVINQALANKVSKIFLPNIDSASIESLLKLSTKYPNACYPMMGLHPCSVKEDYNSVLDVIYKVLKQHKFYGVGECGIDLHWDVTFKSEQIHAFNIQIEWAKEAKLPIIIHSRKSLDLTIDIIAESKDENFTGIYHCFNGSINQAKKVLDNNFYIGLGGVVTYKNAGLEDMIRYMPLEKILLETDAPYLSPVPHRGKRNSSAYLPLIAQKIADIRDQPIKLIMDKTTNNALKLFGLEN